MIAIAVVAIASLFFWKYKDAIFPKDDTTKDTLRPLLCGINSLYMGIGFLTGESGADLYHKIGQRFPNVERNGLSLAKMRNYLTAEGFSCRYTHLDVSLLRQVTSKDVIFLLKDAHTNRQSNV